MAFAAAVLVVLAAAGGAGGAAMNSGASGGGGAAPAAAESIGVRKWDAKRAARSGDTERAMGHLGVAITKQALKQELDCAENSFGQVRDFFLRTPCTSLDRLLLAVGDRAGNAAIVSVAWVTFPGRNQARQFDRVIDVAGSGDVKPLGGAVVGLPDVQFTARHYSSETKDTTITIAEAEPATGHVEPDLLDAMTEVAAQLPRP